LGKESYRWLAVGAQKSETQITQKGKIRVKNQLTDCLNFKSTISNPQSKELQNLAGYDSRCPTDDAKVQI
jgi:hypothetical protein